MTRKGDVHSEEYKKMMSDIFKAQYKNGRKPYWLGKKRDEKFCENLRQKKLGPGTWNWKGGRKKVTGGYIKVLRRGHPNADQRGYILEHRAVMEDFLGRLLDRKEIVHHINHVLDDNRLENLKLYSSHGEHLATEHRDINKGRKLSPEHRAKVVKTLNWYNKHNSTTPPCND